MCEDSRSTAAGSAPEELLPPPFRRQFTDSVRAALTGRDHTESLLRATSQLAALIGAETCSILTPFGDGALRVLASSNRSGQGDVVIPAERHPEMQHMLVTGDAMLVRSAAASDVMQPEQQPSGGESDGGLLALPLRLRSVTAIIRLSSSSRGFSDGDLERLRAASHLIEDEIQKIQHPNTADSWQRLALATSDTVVEVTLDGRIDAVHRGRDDDLADLCESIRGAALTDVLVSADDTRGPLELADELLSGPAWREATAVLQVAGHDPLPVRATAAAAADLLECTRIGLRRQTDELQQLQSRVDELAERRTLFLSASAHELKTPLTVLQVYLESLTHDLAEGLNEEQRSFLTICHESALRLRRLVIDLVDLAAIESGRIQLDIDEVDVSETLETVCAEMRPLAARANVWLSLEAPPELPPARADSRRVRQVVRNLVDNAIRHTPAEGTVAIRARADLESVGIAVEDTGVGIPADRLDTIFDEFVQTHPAQQSDGSGLGLSVCRRLVTALGGRIAVQSREGEGSVFTVSLPRWSD